MEKVSKPSDLSRTLRKALGGITQEQLAARLLLSRNYISQIEAGLKQPSHRVLEVINRMLAESAIAPKVSTTPATDVLAPGVAETQAPYGEIPTIKAELREHLEKLLTLAGDNRNRLGWIAEQMQQHLTPQPHWRPAPGTGAPGHVLAHGSLPSHTLKLSAKTGLPRQDGSDQSAASAG